MSMFISCSDSSTILRLEKCIMKGTTVLLENNGELIDSMLRPIIHHHNSCEIGVKEGIFDCRITKLNNILHARIRIRIYFKITYLSNSLIHAKYRES